MRISKPSTTGEASYEIYQNIALRNQASEKMEDGQEVKILDASGDPNIKNGWAIYKFSKESNLFDLLEKQEQPIIPAPTIINTDESTIFKTENDKLVVPEAMFGTRVDMRILEDFDFSLSYDGKDMQLVPIGGVRTIPVMYGDAKRFLTISNNKLSFALFNNKGKGKRVNWVVNATVSDTNEPVTTQVTGYIDTGETVPVKPNSSDIQLQIMQVSVLVPYNGSAPKVKDFRIHKYWKKALVPAEERIAIPEQGAVNVDNVTLFKTILSEKETIFAPALSITHPANFRILKDFDFTYNIDKTFTGDKTYLDINVIGGNQHIPVMVDGVRKYMSITGEGVVLPDLFNTQFVNKWVYFIMQAVISDTEDTTHPLGTVYESDGSAMLATPYPDSTAFNFMQVGIKVNADGETLDLKNVHVFKYWKNALASINELYTEIITP